VPHHVFCRAAALYLSTRCKAAGDIESLNCPNVSIDDALLTLIEALADNRVAAVIQRILEEKQAISKELYAHIKNAKGMRNFLAHQYGKVDDERVHEAITEELIKRFDKRYFSRLTLTKREYGERELKRSEIPGKRTEGGDHEIPADDLAVARDFKTKNGPPIKLREGYGYSEEREKLNALIREIYVKNSESFSSEEDVFKIFAEAVMTGRLLKVARIIEKTFGKGNFRQLGINTSADMTE